MEGQLFEHRISILVCPGYEKYQYLPAMQSFVYYIICIMRKSRKGTGCLGGPVEQVGTDCFG